MMLSPMDPFEAGVPARQLEFYPRIFIRSERHTPFTFSTTMVMSKPTMKRIFSHLKHHSTLAYSWQESDMSQTQCAYVLTFTPPEKLITNMETNGMQSQPAMLWGLSPTGHIRAPDTMSVTHEVV